MSFLTVLEDHLRCFGVLKNMAGLIEKTGNLLANCIAGNAKILICGNGGSAADAQHFAAELIGRFERDREAWPAVSLTTDTSILTAVGNDYGFNDVFARQVQALGRPGDCLIGISTSGNSENVLRAFQTARNLDVRTVALLGRDGGKIRSWADQAVVVPLDNTARIQETHIFILHFWARCIENHVGNANKA